ncbi:MAG: cupredoxin domain-containing protein [Chloroflexi bacterium]|nr:cupredoxin domain-containing protein [Chloroflexota bacterium]
MIKWFKPPVWAALALAVALALAACGGNYAPPSGGVVAPSGGSSGSREIKVTASDFKFEPNSFALKAGESVKVTMTNRGAVDHNWVVTDSSGKVVFKFTVPVGKTGSGEFTLPAAGTYNLICDVAGHKEAGMSGKITAQ